MLKLLNGYFVLSIFLISFSEIGLGQVGIGTTELENSAILEVKSADKGFLPPRMTANEKSLINNPAEGLVVYCSNCCENGTLLFHNGLTWVAPSPCPDYDLDLDGVPNDTDLDDDNDGILDVAEGSETPIQSVPTAFTPITAGMNANNLDIGDVAVYEDFLADVGGVPVDLRAECVFKDANDGNDRSVLGLSGVQPLMSFTNFEWNQHDVFAVKFTFVEQNSVTLANISGNPIDVFNVEVIYSDIESHGSDGTNSNPFNVSEIGGIGEEYLADGTAVEPKELTYADVNDHWVKYNANFVGPNPKPNLSQYNLITVDPAYAGNVNNWNHEGTIGGNSQPVADADRGTAVIKYDTVSSLDLVFGVTGAVGNSQNATVAGRGARLTIASKYELNTTSSGDVDFKNLDADGDGCFDALEGGAGFTTSQIDGVGKLLGAVDANGIPLLAGTGQTVGDSRNNAVHTACP
jgi:hypothetical protein